MNTDRPVNLSLIKFSFPLAAIASITHRITGVLLFIAFAGLLYVLDLALSSEAGFAEARSLLGEPLPKLVLLAALAALIFHFLAGIKHLLLDFHVGDTVPAAKFGAIVTFVLTVIATAAIGVWLW